MIPLSRTTSNSSSFVGLPLSRTNSVMSEHAPIGRRTSIAPGDGMMMPNVLRRRPSTAGSFSVSTGSRAPTPTSVTQEGSRVREMMKQRLTRTISNHRRSSVAASQMALLEFQRRHGINVMRQRSRVMYHLLRRKAWAVGHMIYWCKMWKKEIESQVRTEDWFLLSEQLLEDSSRVLRDELEAQIKSEFVTLMPISNDTIDTNSYVELRFNKNDFRVDRKSQSSVLSLTARSALGKLPGQRTAEQVLEIVRCLKKLPSFLRFPLTLQKEIASCGFLDCYDKNRVLSRYGRRSDGWYLVLYGKLLLRPQISSGSTDSKVAGVGQIYGEDEVVLNLHRNATVITAEDGTEVLYIYREDYLDAKDRLEGRCRVEDVRETFSAHRTLKHFQFETLSKAGPRSWQAQTFQPGAVIASKEQKRLEEDPQAATDFAVSNLTVSDLIDDRALEKEKSKYFCVVQKGSADVYGVCQETANRKQERAQSDSFSTQMRLLSMLNPSEIEGRKMNKHVQETNNTDASGFMLLLPETWDHNPSNRVLNEKVPRRFQRSTPFTNDPLIQSKITMAPESYQPVNPDDEPMSFVDTNPTPDQGEKKTTVAWIGRVEPGAIFGMESAVPAALEPWTRDDNDLGIQAKALGVDKQPDIYFVSNGCQVILVNKAVYNSGLARDAKCLTASQMPSYHDTAAILQSKDDIKKWTVEKDRLRAYYREMMAKSKKVQTA